MKTKLNPIMIGLSMAFATSPALAEYDINSFVTVGGATSDVPGTYLNRISEGVSLEQDTKYGVNLRAQISNESYGAAQFLATGRDGQFGLEAEWAYISYKISKNFNVRAGKLNLQTFLHSDYKEVGYLYPQIRLPEEVYGFNPMRNFPGVELMHTASLGKSTTLTSQVFVGSAEVMITPNVRMNGYNGYGVNFQLDNEYFTLRAGAITPMVRLTQSSHTTGGMPYNEAILDEKDRMILKTLGLSWDIAGFVGYGEYIKTEADGSLKEVFPDREGSYLTIGYQMGDFLPHITTAHADSKAYAQTAATADFMQNPLIIQDSLALGLRYDVNNFSAIKFEYKQVDPKDTTFNSGFNMGYASDETYAITSVSYDAIF